MMRTATLVWLWQHRHQVPGAVRFLRDAPRRWNAGERSDLIAEARLRMRLGSDARTRDHDPLTTVRDGVAFVSATDPASVAATELARSTRGVREVELNAPAVVTPLSVVGQRGASTDPSLAKLSG